MEDTVVISSADLVEHADLSRKRTETSFRRDFLVRKGASDADGHVQALQKQIEGIELRLKPVNEKLSKVDILTVVPNRAEIISLTNEIEQHPKEKLDEALKSKSGAVYELLKKRASYTKSNFESREQVARLTILLNSLPRKEAENLRTMIESHANDVVDVSALDGKRQGDLLGAMGRLGISAYISSGRLSLEKKPEQEAVCWSAEVEKRFSDVGGVVKTAWIAKERENEWDHNEQRISEVSRKIQIYITRSHAEPLNEGERAEFESMQKEYIELKAKREEISTMCENVSVSLPIRTDS